MALSDITFLRGQGGLGRPLPGEDHVSGLVAYFSNANLPSGFSPTDRVKQVFSTEDAEALGILEGSAVHGVLWYHISQFFTIQPKGELYIGLYDDTAIDYTVIETVQNFADGRVRQLAVMDLGTTFNAANTTTLQSSATALETDHKPLSVLYAADISGVSDLSTLADLRALSNKNVSVVIGEDGAGAGAALAVSSGASVTALGALLGTVALSNVHENISWVGKFNVAQGVELDTPAFGNGDLYKDTTTGAASALQDKGYIFLRKHTGFAGTYWNDAPTAIAATSDFAYIENNRTIDKAVRGVRTFMLPNLGGPLTVDTEGALSEDTIASLKNDADRALEALLVDEEISAFETSIDPSQDVLSTSKVEIAIAIVPRGVARQIEVSIGFTVSVA